MSKLLLRRGLSSQIPNLDIGELGLDIDTFTLRIGRGTNNPSRALIEGSTSTYDMRSIQYIDFGYLDAQLLIPGTSSTRQLTEFFSDVVSCRTFGVVGDGVTDDNLAMLAWASYCSTNHKIAFIPPGMTPLVDQTIAFTALCKGLMMDGATILYRGSPNNPAILIGSQTGTANSVKYEGLNVVNTIQSDFTSLDSIGIELQNIEQSDIEIINVSGFTVGLNLNANGIYGIKYNKITLEYSYNNKIDVLFTLYNAGVIDGNTFPVINALVDDTCNPQFPRRCTDVIDDGTTGNAALNNTFKLINFSKAEISDWQPYKQYAASNSISSYARSNSRIYVCKTSGLSGIGAPSTSSQIINDGSVVWYWVSSEVNTIPFIFNPSFSNNNIESLVLEKPVKYVYRILTGADQNANAPSNNVVLVKQSPNNPSSDDESSFNTNKLLRPIDRMLEGFSRTLLERQRVRRYASRSGDVSSNCSINGLCFIDAAPVAGTLPPATYYDLLAEYADCHLDENEVRIPQTNAVGALFRVAEEAVIAIQAELTPTLFIAGASYSVGHCVLPSAPNGSIYKVHAVLVGGTWVSSNTSLVASGPEPHWPTTNEIFVISGNVMFRRLGGKDFQFHDCYTLAVAFNYCGSPIQQTIYRVANVSQSDNGEVIVTYSNPHPFLKGDKVRISGIVGVAGANGTWTVNVLDSNNISLRGSNYSGTYGGGGTTLLVPLTFTSPPTYVPSIAGYQVNTEFTGADLVYTSPSVSYVWIGLVSKGVPFHLHSLDYHTDRSSKAEYIPLVAYFDDAPRCRSIVSTVCLTALGTTLECGAKISNIPPCVDITGTQAPAAPPPNTTFQIVMASVESGEYWSLWTGSGFDPTNSATWNMNSFGTKLVTNSGLDQTAYTLSNVSRYLLIKATGSNPSIGANSSVMLYKIIASSTSAQIGTVTFDFSVLSGKLGTSQTYTVAGQTMTAYGFTATTSTPWTAYALIGNNSIINLSDDFGLGIASTWPQNPEISEWVGDAMVVDLGTLYTNPSPTPEPTQALTCAISLQVSGFYSPSVLNVLASDTFDVNDRSTWSYNAFTKTVIGSLTSNAANETSAGVQIIPLPASGLGKALLIRTTGGTVQLYKLIDNSVSGSPVIFDFSTPTGTLPWVQTYTTGNLTITAYGFSINAYVGVSLAAPAATITCHANADLTAWAQASTANPIPTTIGSHTYSCIGLGSAPRTLKFSTTVAIADAQLGNIIRPTNSTPSWAEMSLLGKAVNSSNYDWGLGLAFNDCQDIDKVNFIVLDIRNLPCMQPAPPSPTPTPTLPPPQIVPVGQTKCCSYSTGDAAEAICVCCGTGDYNFGQIVTTYANSPSLLLGTYVGYVPGCLKWDVVSSDGKTVYIARTKHINYNKHGAMNIILSIPVTNAASNCILQPSMPLCTGTKGSRTITVDDVCNLRVGQYINIPNAIVSGKILSICNNTLILDTPLKVDCSSIACSWDTPIIGNCCIVNQVIAPLQVVGQDENGSQVTCSTPFPVSSPPQPTHGTPVLSCVCTPSDDDSTHHIDCNIPVTGLPTTTPTTPCDVGVAIWDHPAVGPPVCVNFAKSRHTVSESSGINPIASTIHVSCSTKPGDTQTHNYEVRVGPISDSPSPPPVSLNFGSSSGNDKGGVAQNNLSKCSFRVMEQNPLSNRMAFH